MFAFGSYLGNIQSAVELLDLSSWTWETKSPYPFESSVYNAPTIYINHKFLIFGGYDYPTYFSRIGSYTPSTDMWKTEGYLRTPRFRAGVITVGESFLVVGGVMKPNYQERSEKCEYRYDQLECSYQITRPNQPEPNSKLFNTI